MIGAFFCGSANQKNYDTFFVFVFKVAANQNFVRSFCNFVQGGGRLAWSCPKKWFLLRKEIRAHLRFVRTDEENTKNTPSDFFTGCKFVFVVY